MNLTDDAILKFLLGYPVSFYDLFNIYPSTVGEIIDLGYTKFQAYLSIMTAEKPLDLGKDSKEIKEMLESLSDFQYIILMTVIDPQSNQFFKEAFKFFTHEENIDFSMDPAQIVIIKDDNKHLLDEEKFYEFQRILKRAFFLEQEGEEIIIDSKDDLATRAIKMKMKENREKLRKAKAKKARQEKNDLQFSDLLASLPFQNCGLNIDNIKNITYYALNDQIKRSGWHEQFDINNRAAMAGAKLKKSQLKHWIRSIASSDKS